MHISPCGWYCFKTGTEKEPWNIRDTMEKTLITFDQAGCEIELLSARKDFNATDEEISENHEKYLASEKIIPRKTVVSENPFGVRFFVTNGTGPDECHWAVCHAFWSNYCVFIRFRCIPHPQSNRKLQVFYDILNTLQPLALI